MVMAKRAINQKKVPNTNKPFIMEKLLNLYSRECGFPGHTPSSTPVYAKEGGG